MSCYICGNPDGQFLILYNRQRVMACRGCVDNFRSNNPVTKCPMCGIFYNSASRRAHNIAEIGSVCPDCWDEEICDYCGSKTITDTTHPFRGIYIRNRNDEYSLCCGSCINRGIGFLCRYCGCYFRSEGHTYHRDGICNECLDGRRTRCHSCGHQILDMYADNVTTVGGTVHFCRRCVQDGLDEGEVLLCNRCENIFTEDVMYRMGSLRLCHDCFSEADRCELCGRPTLSGNVCSDCRNIAIKSHNFQPRKNYFYNLGPNDEQIYLGLELEMSCPMNTDRAIPAVKMLNQFSPGEELFYIKHDGSVENGWEIVSHPCTLEYHKYRFPWPEICKKASLMGLKSHNTSCCGLHVHISNNLSYTEAIQFGTFVYNNRGLNEVVARRKGTDYSRYKKADKIKFGSELKELPYSEDRYEAVNYTNDKTLELRIFRGSLKFETVMACVEYTYAIYKFTQTISIQKCISDHINKFFLEYVKKNRKSYEYLFHYLKNWGVL